MAVVNTKSTIVTNRDASPPLENKLWYQGARVYEDVAAVEVAAADDDTSVFRLFRVRSNWRISSIEVGNDALSTGASYDIGVFDTAENGAAAVNSDEFASAVDMSGAHALTDYTYEAVATDISKIGMQLWERLGLASDPGKEYDICAYAVAAGTAAGTIAARLKYVKGQ